VCNVNLKEHSVMQRSAPEISRGVVVNCEYGLHFRKQPEPYFLHYGVSKAGVISMTKVPPWPSDLIILMSMPFVLVLLSLTCL